MPSAATKKAEEACNGQHGHEDGPGSGQSHGHAEPEHSHQNGNGCSHEESGHGHGHGHGHSHGYGGDSDDESGVRQLTEAAALDQETLLQIVALGAINAPMFALKGPNMIKGAYPPAFPLKHQQKDMRLALALGDELAQEMPVAAAANEMYKTARRMGKDDEDFSAVIAAVGRK